MTPYEQGEAAAEEYHSRTDLLGHILSVEPIPPHYPGGEKFAEWVDGFLGVERDDV